MERGGKASVSCYIEIYTVGSVLVTPPPIIPDCPSISFKHRGGLIKYKYSGKCSVSVPIASIGTTLIKIDPSGNDLLAAAVGALKPAGINSIW